MTSDTIIIKGLGESDISFRISNAYLGSQVGLHVITALATAAWLYKKPASLRLLATRCTICSGAVFFPFGINLLVYALTNRKPVRSASKVLLFLPVALLGAITGVQVPSLLMGAKRIWNRGSFLKNAGRYDILMGLSGLELLTKPLVLLSVCHRLTRVPQPGKEENITVGGMIATRDGNGAWTIGLKKPSAVRQRVAE